MADLDTLERQVVDIIAQKKRLPPENITLDSTFLDLGIDSLDGMDLLFAFEDTFNISIPDDVAQQMKSVRMVTEGLRRVLGNRAVAST
ncbi:MAG: phosphopantetheine-binding [Acidobacteria bacterium]|nr:phosphopantetheine-binding [Acidobacteriota bacterium]